MKKAFALLVFLNLIFLFDSTASAQQASARNRAGLNEKSAVSYVAAEAFSSGAGVLIRWETAAEVRTLGFNIYRVSGGRKQIVNSSLISGLLLQTRGGSVQQTDGRDYTFFDAAGGVGSVYYIESRGLNNENFSTRQFSARAIADGDSPARELYDAYKKSASEASPTIQDSEINAPGAMRNKTDGDAPTSDIAMQRFVAAQPGVKIAVKKEGFYRVMRANLESGGFNVNTSSDFWQLYLNGVEQSIIVGGNGDYIEFYGNGVDARDTDTQTYFLIVGAQNGKRVAADFIPSTENTDVAVSYQQSFVYKERNQYTPTISNGETENFFGRLLGSAPSSILLSLTGVDFTSPNSSLDITIQGIYPSPHQTVVTLNGVAIGTLDGFNYDSMTQHFNIPTSILIEGNNNLQLKTTGGSLDYSRFDTVKINYPRQYQAYKNRLTFPTTANKTTYLTGFTKPNLRVFEIGSPDAVKLNTNLQIQQLGRGNYRVRFPAYDSNHTFYVVQDRALQSVSSIVPNSPSTLVTGNHAADLVIITHRDWLTQANTWANYRAAQGLTVEVVDVEDIYDEFSFGAFSSDAVKNFLQHSLNNWQTHYALLLGDATYDPRNYTGDGLYNFVPTKLVETFDFETASDESLADFDNDALGELAVGRIPAHSGQDVTQALNKITAFEQTAAQGLDRGVLFASDLPRGYNFESLSSRVSGQLLLSTPKFYINRYAAASSNTELINEINEGRFLVNYSGHGSRSGWGDSFPQGVGVWFNSSAAAQLTNGGSKLSIFSLLTCLNGQFTNPVDSMSEVLLKNQNGGGAAVWSSTGDTTPDIQEIMAARFYNQIAAGNLVRIGDLTRDAKTVISYGRDVRLTWTLLGDPTMKVR